MTHMRKFILLLSMFFLPLLFWAFSDSIGVFALEEDGADGYVAAVGEAKFSDFGEALAAWTQDATLTLLSDTECGGISVSEEKTIDLNGKTLSLIGGATGSVISVTGTLTVRDGAGGGRITGGNAAKGGGILVDAAGKLSLMGGEISGNRASEQGGGVCALGRLSLSGNTVISDNTDSGDNASNLFLSYGNRVNVSDFSGRVGVCTPDPEEFLSQDFVREEFTGEGEFFSDDKQYIVSGTRFAVAPLAQITVTYEGTEKVFPATRLSSIEEHLKVEGTNVNGVPYLREIEVSIPDQLLSVGENTVRVTAQGKDGGEATGEFTLQVVAPCLLSIEVLSPEYPPEIYFDTPVEEVLAQYTVRGEYEDGNFRAIYTTGEETASKTGDSYITDYYIVSGNLAERENGVATLTVTVFTEGGEQFSETVGVTVSRRLLSAGDFTVNNVTVVEKSDAWSVLSQAFVSGFPEGIEPVLKIDGERFSFMELGAGVYEVEISFLVKDTENYEISGTRTALLTVNRANFDVTDENNAAIVSFSAEGGIPPEWEFTVREDIDVRHPALEGNFEILQAVSIALLREDKTELPSVTVRLRLGDKARQAEDLKLYRVRADGSLEEIAFTRDGNDLVFEGNEFMDTQFVIAADSGFGVYLALGITFGAVCVVAAMGFFCFLIFKRNMRLR